MFYANPKKCVFCTDNIIFLGFAERVFADPEKVKAITKWPKPRTIREVRSFHGLATFYRRFIKNFSAIIAPKIDCLKNKKFQWTPATTKAFKEVKRLMTQAPVIYQNFQKYLK